VTAIVAGTPVSLTLGQLLVIRGTEISFYIPPTGIEVVPESGEKYVRKAVTLERLEYCILLDENGNKRFVQGPAVVFPEPTETFVEMERSVKFRAIELLENSGIHIKVIAEYRENDQTHRAGDELFITGKDQAIYFPRPEHAIIKYDGEQEIHFATAVPAGEGRYLLSKKTGEVALVVGPKMLLPDPRREVLVQRVLDTDTVKLWFPDNSTAIEVNQALAERLAKQGGQSLEHIPDDSSTQYGGHTMARMSHLAGEQFQRASTYSPPRTITLDTKYKGAVLIDVWPGYAVQVVSKTGKREVAVGPQTMLLQYDESLMRLALSTGKPKTTDRLFHTVYLKVVNNQVSDVIEVETGDLCKIQVKVAYRVNFIDKKDKWFSVENYVKLICDHGRSIMRNVAKQHGVERFYADAVNIIRDAILGKSAEGNKRPGRHFDENDAHIYDVEVLGVDIKDGTIANLLLGAQRRTVERTLEVAQQEQELEFTRRAHKSKRDQMKEEAATMALDHEIQVERAKQSVTLVLEQMKQVIERDKANLVARQESQKLLDDINTSELARKDATTKLDIEARKLEIENKKRELDAEAEALERQAKAISADLIAALQAFGDKDLIIKASHAVSPLTILGGESVVDVINKLFKGTPLAHLSNTLLHGNGLERPVARQ
jgi:major vault protein